MGVHQCDPAGEPANLIVCSALYGSCRICRCRWRSGDRSPASSWKLSYTCSRPCSQVFVPHCFLSFLKINLASFSMIDLSQLPLTKNSQRRGLGHGRYLGLGLHFTQAVEKECRLTASWCHSVRKSALKMKLRNSIRTGIGTHCWAFSGWTKIRRDNFYYCFHFQWDGLSLFLFFVESREEFASRCVQILSVSPTLHLSLPGGSLGRLASDAALGDSQCMNLPPLKQGSIAERQIWIRLWSGSGPFKKCFVPAPLHS